MNNNINPAQVYQHAKAQWMRTEAPKRNIEDRFFDLRIVLLMLAFVGMGVLSSSHTIDAFGHIVPQGLALVSPFAFELYLISTTLAGDNQKADLRTKATQGLIFVVAVIANGASGWQQARTTPDPTMSFIFQGMALIAASIVPLATMSIGHQLALAIQTRQTTDKVADAWTLAEFQVFYRALYTAYNLNGMPPKDARAAAQADVQGYLASVRSSGGIRPSAVSTSERTADTKQTSNGQRTNGSDKKAQVMAYFKDHPELLKLSINDALNVIRQSGIDVGRSTVHEVKQYIIQNADTQPVEVPAEVRAE